MLAYDYLYLGTAKYSVTNQSLSTKPTILLVDNKAATQMAINDQLTKRTRHIERRFMCVREGQRSGAHILVWISNDHMLADTLTKTQGADKIWVQVDRSLWRLPAHML